MIVALKVISEQLLNLGLNYEFGRMTKSPIAYPYWVGDYSQLPIVTEDGKEELSFTLTGFSRGDFLSLEIQKQAIKDHYKYGVSVITDSGAVVVVFYGGAFNIPQEEPDLKKCQVNLSIKIWKE